MSTPGITLKDLRDHREQAPFFRDLERAVVEGRRDFVTGNDQVVSEFIDPRVSGWVDGSFLLARSLASAWRCPEQEPHIPVVVIVGTADTPSRYRVLPIEEWPHLANLHGYDGVSAAMPSGSRTRRFLVQIDSLAAKVIWGICTSMTQEDSSEIDGMENASTGISLDASLTIRLGVASRDGLLDEALRRTGVLEAEGSAEIAVVLLLMAPVQGEINVVDAGSANAWRNSLTPHLDGTHVTPILARMMHQDPAPETWTDEAFRESLRRELAANKGSEPTMREYLNALANAHSMRNVFPVWLTRFFPEVETIFWCCGDPMWDKSSPAERFALLGKVSSGRNHDLAEISASLI